MREEPISQQAEGFPPGFTLLNYGSTTYGSVKFVVVNLNSDNHRSKWDSVSEARDAAWQWWYDVKDARK